MFANKQLRVVVAVDVHIYPGMDHFCKISSTLLLTVQIGEHVEHFELLLTNFFGDSAI